MVSFDVESLFTNIPVKETIEIILNRAFKDNNEYFHDMNRATLERLLTICTQESHFQFNGKYYDQTDGMAMGSPLGSTFADIFLDEYETKHMNILEELGVESWLRYVDDIWSTVKNDSCIPKILEYMNSLHPNLKFTVEYENNNKIPFLDTCINRKETGFKTNIYHKPTFTGVYLNWTSLTARKYKISLIYCLCDRIWKICQDPADREDEFKKLKLTLEKNEYPPHIIEQEITKFINNRNKTTDIQPSGQEATAQDTKTKKYICLPYVNRKADEFAQRLTKIVNETFPKIELRVAFKAPNEIGKMFPFKDNLKETYKQSLVVYKIKCETCGAAYIGKTERILAYRMKEHNKKEEDAEKQKSAIQTHLKQHKDHIININNIEIIDRASNNYKLQLKEMIHINKQKPELNTQYAAWYKKTHNKELFSSQMKTYIIAKSG